jgi:hypothetical protein
LNRLNRRFEDLEIVYAYGILPEVMFEVYVPLSSVQGRLMSDASSQNDRQSLGFSPGHVSLLIGQLLADLLPVDVSGRPALQ